MSDFDPEDQTSPAGPQDNQSSDQSKPGLRAAWDAWTSRPENNAALLQFGLAMLQPRAPGQSGVGQFANAIGQGAEASDRNIAQQQATETGNIANAAKQSEASARTTTANAYADQVKQGAVKGDKTGLQGQIRMQADFRKWLAKPTNDLETDPVLAAISKQFPDVKTKGDLLANPAARGAAWKLFQAQLAEPSEDGSDTEGADGTPALPSPSPGSRTAPVTSGPRIIYKGNVPYQWDGVPGHPPVLMRQ